MQINIALNRNNEKQASVLREAWYANTNARETRDSFIFDTAISKFDARLMNELLPIIERDSGLETVQKMLTIKQDSNKKLENIATALGRTKTATYRAIIAYWIDRIGVIEEKVKLDCKERTDESKSQLLIVKVALLEKHLADCSKMLNEIKKLIG